MGWFWADSERRDGPVYSRSSAPSVPQCPMHRPESPTRPAFSSQVDGSCPYNPNDSSSPSTRSDAVPESRGSHLNPLNYMPFNISQSRAEKQTVELPTQRSVSTIPKGSASEEGHWVYPSPQQMYNALLRKGATDTPQDAVEEMVAVHNFLNEGAWAEIVEWERRFAGGLRKGWQECSGGDAASTPDASFETLGEHRPQPRLLRLEGRPKDMTPKATIVQAMGWVYPSRFGCQPPFDRHDWYVQRQMPDGQAREVRYVIDYYSAPPDPSGESVFYLDIRPAIDRPSAAVERLMRWGGDVWYRMSGAASRDGSSQQLRTSVDR